MADDHPAKIESANERPGLTWILLLVLGAAFMVVGYLVMEQRLRAGRGMPDFSVYSEGRNGLAKAAWLLEQLGWQTVALTRPIQQTRHHGLLIMVEPQEQANMLGLPIYLSASESKSLLNWVAAGNTLLYCGRNTSRLHTDLGVAVVGKVDKKSPILHRAQPAFGGFTQQINDMEVEGRLTLGSRRGLPLWWLDEQPAALLFKHGQGRVLFVADPSLLTHRGLVRQDNVMFLCNVARLCSINGVVYFDEYHHGIRASSGYWSYLRFHGHHWLVLQLLIVFGIGVWAIAVRLGPAKATPLTSRADGVDYASAVARIYQQAGVKHRMARWLVVDFLNRLTRHLRLRRNAPPAQILAAWKKHTHDPHGPDLEPLLQGVSRLRQVAHDNEQIPSRDLLHWAKEFDDFLKAYVIH